MLDRMPTQLKEFLQQWLINTVAVLAATYVVPGIYYQDWQHLIAATFILGILNTFVRPVLTLFSLPLMFLTLGLFRLIINAFLLYAVSELLAPAFEVGSFGQALWGALVISIISLVLHHLTRTGSVRIEVRRNRRGGRQDRPSDGDGPVIDI